MVAKRTLIILTGAVLSGCATAPPLPHVSQMAPVHLCYEHLVASQGRAYEVLTEIQLRRLDCNNYLDQLNLMANAAIARQQAAQQQARAMLEAFNQNQARSQQTYQQIMQDITRPRAIAPSKPVIVQPVELKGLQYEEPTTCRSERQYDGSVKTVCRKGY